MPNIRHIDKLRDIDLIYFCHVTFFRKCPTCSTFRCINISWRFKCSNREWDPPLLGRLGFTRHKCAGDYTSQIHQEPASHTSHDLNHSQGYQECWVLQTVLPVIWPAKEVQSCKSKMAERLWLRERSRSGSETWTYLSASHSEIHLSENSPANHIILCIYCVTRQICIAKWCLQYFSVFAMML